MNLAVGDEQLPGGRGVLPAHTAGLAEEELALFGAGAALQRGFLGELYL